MYWMLFGSIDEMGVSYRGASVASCMKSGNDKQSVKKKLLMNEWYDSNLRKSSQPG